MPRPIYLIAHNPNSVDDAVAVLSAGANALEPDIYFVDNNFYVMEMIPVWSKLFPPKKGPLLADYLTGLQTKITASQNNNQPLQLALILFDTKNIDHYEVNKLMDVVRTNFTLPVCFGITTGNKKYLDSFLNFTPKKPTEKIGIDRGCDATDAQHFFQEAKMNYTYANGTSLPLIPTTSSWYLDEIRAAIQLRDSGSKIRPTLVYAWTVNSKESMRTYLRLGADGFITDKIKDAVSVIAEPEFSGKVEQASSVMIRAESPFVLGENNSSDKIPHLVLGR